MHEALCRSFGTTLDICMARDGPPITQRTSGLDERGAFVPVVIGERALDVLEVLIQQPRVLVSKDEIMQAVWPHATVENANLTMEISALRRVLDQGRVEGSCIQTVAAQGYRFVAPVTRVERAKSIGTVAPAAIADTSAGRLPRATARRWRIALPSVAATAAALVGRRAAFCQSRRRSRAAISRRRDRR